jgi:hypothetical protein
MGAPVMICSILPIDREDNEVREDDDNDEFRVGVDSRSRTEFDESEFKSL